MRNVIVSNLISVDGLLAGPGGSIDWHVLNDEFFDYANALLDRTDTLLYGRVTYEGMAAYWPTPQALANDGAMARRMNAIHKVVFSTTLAQANWQNTRLVSGEAGAEVRRLKAQPGQDMVIFGSGRLVSSLTDLGLIDRFQLFINPVILGSGVPEFSGLAQAHKLRLLESKVFKTGVVLLAYAPAGQ